jgi:hypothetical protein
MLISPFYKNLFADDRKKQDKGYLIQGRVGKVNAYRWVIVSEKNLHSIIF